MRLMTVTKDDLNNNPGLHATMLDLYVSHGIDPHFVSIEHPSWFFTDQDGVIYLSYPEVQVASATTGAVRVCYSCDNVQVEREVVML